MVGGGLMQLLAYGAQDVEASNTFGRSEICELCAPDRCAPWDTEELISAISARHIGCLRRAWKSKAINKQNLDQARMCEAAARTGYTFLRSVYDELGVRGWDKRVLYRAALNHDETTFVFAITKGSQ